MNTMLMLALASISLAACSSMSGNVVPEKGPTMEEVYDSMEKDKVPSQTVMQAKTIDANVHLYTANSSFHKLPNPELTMYVFPHLAGNEEVPVPGYFTVFNAYAQDHYALPNETPMKQ